MNKSELYGVQMLRALAALAVVIHHTLEESNGSAGRFSPDWLTTAGASGVDIFFFISGFIMLYVSFPANRRPLSAGKFLLRRTTRIYPLYWLCCFAMLLASGVGLMKRHSWSGEDAIASLLLIPNENALISVAWTLVYEMYFYFIFAFTLVFRSIHVSVLGSTAAIVGFGSAGSFLPLQSLRAFLANPIPLEFCMGLGIAWAFQQRWWRTNPVPICFVIGISGLGMLVAAPLFVPHSGTSGLQGIPRVLAWGLPAALVVISVLSVGAPTNRFTQFAVLLGDASYALYLTHIFLMIVYAWLLKNSLVGQFHQLLLLPLVIATSIGLACLVHSVVEEPVSRFIRNLTVRQPIVKYQ